MVHDLKNELLKSSNNGLDFFKIYFGDKLQWASKKRSRNLKSPFYTDKNGSLSIYQDNKGKWRFKDYGDPAYQGDCFDFYARVYNTNTKEGFSELLIVMKRALEEGISKIATVKAFQNDTVLNERTITTVKLNKIGFTDKALQFWKQYNITQEILLLNNVSQVVGYREFYSDGEDKYITLNQDLVFAYTSGNFYKFYSPQPKKFWSVGIKTTEYRFGENYQPNDSTVFLVGGEKDVMTLHALGYRSVCLSSETVLPSKRFAKNMFEDEVKVVVFYDNDEAGHKGAQKIASIYSWEIAELKSILTSETEKETKDISEYVKLGLSLDKVKTFLDEFRPREISHTTQVLEEIKDEELEQEPNSGHYIPESVYSNLPPSVKEAVVNFGTNRRDLVLVGCLGVLSNIIKVTGIYDHKTVYPNLFIFITAPASAGKSDLSWAKKLGNAINATFKQKYNRENEEYKNDRKNKERPLRKRLFISGNASHSALLQQLYINDGEGVMIETEADTLNNALDNDWGNYSYVLRQVYEFETVGKLRREEEEIVEIEKPRLSVILSGTKDQLLKLVPSPENGLFSRFIFVELPIMPKWRNPFERKLSFDSHYDTLSYKYLEYYNLTRSKLFNFELTDQQIVRFNIYHSEKQDHDNVMLGLESVASVRRMAGMHFRLAMLLSTIRHLDQGKSGHNVICEDIDFEISLKLIKWFSGHTKRLFNQLPKKVQHYPELKKEISIFYDKLNEKFSFSEARAIAEDMGIAFSTMEGYLRKLLKIRLITRFKQGLYSKETPQ